MNARISKNLYTFAAVTQGLTSGGSFFLAGKNPGLSLWFAAGVLAGFSALGSAYLAGTYRAHPQP